MVTKVAAMSERVITTADETSDREVAVVQRVARWMDVLALDPVLGFVLPGVGDVVGSVFGLYVVSVAVRRRLPVVVIARMLLNLGIDTLIGVVPIAGDLADVAFRAHRRNAELLLSRQATGTASWRDWALVAGAAGLLVGALVLSAWAAIALVRAVF
jgi:hypothetical protein